jgi:hypothetical protein
MYCRTFDCSHRAGAVVGRCCPGIGGNAAIGSIQICQSGAGSDFCRLCWNFGISQLENTQGTSLKRLSCPPPQAILIVKPASRFFYGSALTVHGQPVPLKRAISSERFQASDFKSETLPSPSSIRNDQTFWLLPLESNRIPSGVG